MNIRHLIRQRDKLTGEIEDRKRDLDALERVIAMFDKRGTDLSDKQMPVQPLLRDAQPLAPPNGASTHTTAANGDEGSPKLIGRVRFVLETMQGQFTKRDIFKKIREKYPRTSVDLTEQDVATVVWRMANKTGELKTVTLGKGGEPSIYGKAKE